MSREGSESCLSRQRIDSDTGYGEPAVSSSCRSRRSWRAWTTGSCVALLASGLAACSNGPRYPSAESPVTTTEPSTSINSTPLESSPAVPPSTSGPGSIAPLPVDADLVIRNDLAGRPIDRRVLGTNVPAWLGPGLLTDPAFQRAAIDSGTTLLRMPGGSWSNSYDWLGCENGDETTCYWPWAARPTDFIDFMQATSLPGMWTVSINATAQSAAAAVAFFNGAVDDVRPIGIDRDGVDWQTVGTWASLRAEHGNLEPIGLELWEVGNEVFGGKPDGGGTECADFGWEDVWTCDGATYVIGDDHHDGYLAIRAAMIAVDPNIQVGAVGVPDPMSWSNWGNEVIDESSDALDFYVVHQYGFDAPPSPEEVLSRPATLWPELVQTVRAALPPDVPMALTEYNLVSFESADPEKSMTRAVNALFIADTIGQLVVADVPVANQWNLANGTTSSGTDYGLISVDDGSRFPQFTAMAMWGATGDTLLVTEGSIPDSLRVYPTRHADETVTIVLLNLGDEEVELDLAVVGAREGNAATLTTARSDDLAADRLIEELPLALAVAAGGAIEAQLPPWSMNLLEVAGA